MSVAATNPAPKAKGALVAPLQVVAKRNVISWKTMTFMTVSLVCSLRAAPTMAVFGLGAILLYAIPAVLFFLPQTMISAELASAWPGGIYRWVTEAFGPKIGLLAVWCQYAQTIFYYPAVLAYVAATVAYVIDPSLASNGMFTAIVIIAVYWASVIVSGRGMKAVSGLSSAGSIIGTIIPGVVLVVNNVFSYAGMEVNAVHVSELKDPKREFPKVMFATIVICVAVFILSALAVAWVVPNSTVSLTAGVMQAFSDLFGVFHLGFLTPVIAVMIIIAMLSGMIAWLAGPSTGLLLIGREEGFIPPYFQKLNKHGMQMNIFIWQGIVTTIIACLYAFIPVVSDAYWIFEVMTLQIYLIMYLLMFLAAMKLRKSQPGRRRRDHRSRCGTAARQDQEAALEDLSVQHRNGGVHYEFCGYGEVDHETRS